MPVEKYRRVEDMPSLLWGDPAAPGYFERLARTWSQAARLFPRPRPRGVFKFRSVDEAWRSRAQGAGASRAPEP
jgi:hypothetical protein